jgi:virginiamycin B lyase
VVTEYAVPTPNSGPWYITTGPDGALWFTENSANKIGRITTSGQITEYALPTQDQTNPLGITTGPGGALWFTESGNGLNKIGRITTGGAITESIVPTANNSEVIKITVGPDGALWFAEAVGNRIGRAAVSSGPSPEGAPA